MTGTLSPFPSCFWFWGANSNFLRKNNWVSLLLLLLAWPNQSNIGEFLSTLTDSDLNVRRVALVALNSAAHNKPSLVRDLLKDLLPHLYNETQKVSRRPWVNFIQLDQNLFWKSHFCTSVILTSSALCFCNDLSKSRIDFCMSVEISAWEFSFPACSWEKSFSPYE